MEKNMKKEKERQFIKRYFKENLKINLEDLVKNGIMNEKEFEKFLDRQFKLRFKTCNCCGFIMPKTEFYRDTTHSDGLYCYCKKCHYGKYTKKNDKKNGKAYRDREKAKNRGYYVYLIFNKKKELCYVGSTTNMHTRMKSHFYGQVDATKELFLNNDVSLVEYVQLKTKEEMQSLEVILINNKKRNPKEPCMAVFDLYGEYIVDYPRLNINRGSGEVDRKLLVKICSKLRCHEYNWFIWKEFGFGEEDDE